MKLVITVPGDDLSSLRLLAAVFADGTTAGNAVVVKGILENRRRAYYDIPLAIDILQQGGEPAALVARLEQWRKQYFSGHKALVQSSRTASPEDFGHWPMLMPNPVVLKAISLLKTMHLEEVIRKLVAWHEVLEQSKPPL